MNDTTTRSVSPGREWLRRCAIVMSLIAVPVGLLTSVWMVTLAWRQTDGSHEAYYVHAMTQLGIGLSGLWAAGRVRDGEFSEPLRHVMICAFFGGAMVIGVRFCMTLAEHAALMSTVTP